MHDSFNIISITWVDETKRESVFAVQDFFAVLIDKGICFFFLAEYDDHLYFIVSLWVDRFLIFSAQLSFDADYFSILC